MPTKNHSDMLKKALDDFDKQREEVIQAGRELTKLAKQAIYDVHRKDLKAAETKLSGCKKLILQLKKLGKQNPKLMVVGNYSGGMEEYAEAAAYYGFVKTGKIPSFDEIGVDDAEDYLGGLSDLTGELARKTVFCAIDRDDATVTRIRQAVDDIFGMFLQFNLRNGDLRKKADAIKWNLKKIEEIVYDLSLKK
ncbi:hypothetical protein HZB01_01325 [Candidatus Woesearchaeota archaeon]|nr:hypothetical protein [Candidatus Woesearchaeota archaeon]